MGMRKRGEWRREGGVLVRGDAWEVPGTGQSTGLTFETLKGNKRRQARDDVQNSVSLPQASLKCLLTGAGKKKLHCVIRMEAGGESNGKRHFCKAGMFGEGRRAVPSCPAGYSVTEHVNSAVSAR